MPSRISPIPGCPWAYSASPAHAVLRWRYGDQLQLAAGDDRADRAGRAVRAARLHAREVRARLPALPPPRHAVRDPAARRASPRRGAPAARSSRRGCTRPSYEYAVVPRAPVRLVHDAAGARRPERPRDGAGPRRGPRRRRGARPRSTTRTSRRPTRPTAPRRAPPPARRPRRRARPRRPTGPCATPRRRWSSSSDGRRLEAGGFQPVEAYDVLLANLDPTLERTPPPEDPLDALRRSPTG